MFIVIRFVELDFFFLLLSLSVRGGERTQKIEIVALKFEKKHERKFNILLPAGSGVTWERYGRVNTIPPNVPCQKWSKLQERGNTPLIRAPSGLDNGMAASALVPALNSCSSTCKSDGFSIQTGAFGREQA